jgi:CRISPR-associated protein Cas1
MPPLYVIEQGAKVHVEGRRLLVKKEDAELSSAPLVSVSEVVLMGNVGLTTQAIKLLLSENVDVVFLTEDGNYCGRLTGPATPHVLLRRKQYAVQGDAGFALKMGQAMVRGKLLNERSLLLRHNRERKDAATRDRPHASSTEWDGRVSAIVEAVRALEGALERIPRTTTANSLAGVEGAATAAYFGAWKRLLKMDWHFEKRLRRPPPDPINVLLSFGYTLLTRTAWSAVEAAGLDPYAGFLHVVDYNRPSLALDLVEEFRAVVDGVILWCVNSGQIVPEDFAKGDEHRPVVMSDKAKRVFIGAYERRMEEMILHPPTNERLSVRRCIMAQAREMVRCIQKGEPEYGAMVFR